MQRNPAWPPVTVTTFSTGVAAGGTGVPVDGSVVGSGVVAGGVVVVPGSVGAVVVVEVVDVPGVGIRCAAGSSTSLPARAIANHATAAATTTTASQVATATATVRRARGRRAVSSATGPPCHRCGGYGLGMASILLVEDDAAIRSAVTRALTARGHVVDTRPTGMAGLQAAIDDRPDVVLLDLGLPDTDGLQVLSMLRAVSAVPVIVVTARDDGGAVVKALDAGADDYVIKPFDVAQVEARLRAVLRRSGADAPEPAVTVGDLVVDAQSREVTLGGERIELSRKEFDLLHVLASNVGRVVTKRELLAEVWRQPYGGAERTVDVHLSWLRRKLGETAAAPRYLHSVRGVGVRLVDPGA